MSGNYTHLIKHQTTVVLSIFHLTLNINFQGLPLFLLATIKTMIPLMFNGINYDNSLYRIIRLFHSFADHLMSLMELLSVTDMWWFRDDEEWWGDEASLHHT